MKVNPCVELDAEERHVQYRLAYGTGEAEYCLNIPITDIPDHYNEEMTNAWLMGWRAAERSDESK